MLSQINEMETKVLNELVASSAGNGHDFGMVEDVGIRKLGITGRQLGGYVTKLSQKGYIKVYPRERVNNEYWVT